VLNSVQPDIAANGAAHTSPSTAALLNEKSGNDAGYNDANLHINSESDVSQTAFNEHDFDDGDDSYVGEPSQALNQDHYDDRPMTLSEKAKLALGRENASSRPGLKAVAAAGAAGVAATSASAAASRAFSNDSDVAVAEAPQAQPAPATHVPSPMADEYQADNQPSEPHPLDGLENQMGEDVVAPMEADHAISENTESALARPAGAVIEIQNGAKSGQVLPIDKPVTTLGRPGIQIAAIMRKPDGYFLMHIESDDSVDMPTLNRDTIGDDPVMLHSGDRLNVAGIDVEFMLS